MEHAILGRKQSWSDVTHSYSGVHFSWHKLSYIAQPLHQIPKHSPATARSRSARGSSFAQM